MSGREESVYTSGPIGIRMLKTAAAMLMGTFAMSGYNIVDTYFVAQLGKTMLAAMGFTFPVIMLIGCVFHGIGTGVVTPAAQLLGGRRKKKASDVVTSGILLTLLFSTLLAVLGMMTAGPLFHAFGAEGQTLIEVRKYMDVWYLGCATASLSMLGNSLLIAVGDSKCAGMMMVLGLLLNALLDPLFIFGWGPVPGMQIRGAALATILSQCLSTVATLSIAYCRHELFSFRFIRWKILAPSWLLTVRYAVPASFGMIMMPIGSAVITWITAKFGDDAVAATAASGRLEMAAFVFPMALGISLTPMVAQNYGARLYSRIRKCLFYSNLYAFVFLMAMAVIYVVFRRPIVHCFSPDGNVRDIMETVLLIIPWGFASIEIHRFAGFFYIGCGRPLVAAWLNVFRILGLMIPFSFLALAFHSLTGLFFARLAADLIAGATGFFLAWRMTARLPAEDGAPPPAVRTDNVIGRVFHPRSLLAFGTAQAKIDSSSDTQ